MILYLHLYKIPLKHILNVLWSYEQIMWCNQTTDVIAAKWYNLIYTWWKEGFSIGWCDVILSDFPILKTVMDGRCSAYYNNMNKIYYIYYNLIIYRG